MKPQNSDFMMWSQDQTHTMGAQKGFTTAKPLISILDLGKLLLQYSRDGDAAKVHELIIKGAPFNADWLGMTPLHYAAKRNSYEICDMLLRGGINKDAKTKVDRTALHFAVYEGNKEVVELLLSRNAEVNIKDMLRMTALHWAIEKGHKAIVRLLLKHGADVSIVSKFDRTPITIAALTGQVDLIQELDAARHNQRNKVLLEAQENQSETNEAVNSITLDTLSTPKFDLSSLVEDEEMPLSKEENSDIQGRATNKCGLSDKNRVVVNENDEEIDYVEPIVNLMDDTKEMDESALEMLKHHGITMLPTDDPQNLLATALQGGRKLVLSEAGKLVLKEAGQSQMTESRLSDNGANMLRRISHNHSQSNRNSDKKMPIVLRHKTGTPLKSNKNVKIISLDMFRQMYGNDLCHPLKKIVKPNLNTTHQPKITKLIKLNNVSNRKPVVQKLSIQEFRDRTHHASESAKGESVSNDADDLPPNIIEVCSESDSEDETIDGRMTRSPIKINNLQSSNFPPSKPVLAVAPQVHNEPTTLEIPEICKQLHDLRRQVDELRRQLEQTQKQNDEYRMRLERVERDREDFS